MSTTIPASLIARETAISIVINTAISFGFFLLVFGWQGPLAVWGVGQLAFDNVIQAFMIALMSTLVPGAILLKRVRGSLFVRALVAGISTAVIGGALLAAILALTAIPELAWRDALLLKLAFGATIAAIVTPISLRATARVR